MLEPKVRQTLLQLLRPPDGCRFDCAVGTTFSLDLMALLTAPLAMAMFDWQDAEGDLASDPALPGVSPLELLESLRRCADRVHIFCQAGYIHVPPADQRLLTFLERSVVQVVVPPTSAARRPIFHPKVWLLRYVDRAGAVRYRLLCLTRNLTFDRAWDAVVALDGVVGDRQRPIGMNGPLVEFLTALPSMQVREGAVTSQARADIDLLRSEVARVEWELPDSVTKVAFHPLGLTGRARWPFPKNPSRALVLSPFLTEDFLERLAGKPQARYLISRAEALCEISPELLRTAWTCHTIKDAAYDLHGTAASPDVGKGAEELRGLHAKLFVVDDDTEAHVWLGSANATHPAFHGNVEFLVEMVGPKRLLGVYAMLGQEDKATGLAPLLADFEPGEQAEVPDPEGLEAEALLDASRVAIASLPWRASVRTAGAGFELALACGEIVTLESGVGLRCRPASLPPTEAVGVTSGCRAALAFGNRAEESITSFFVFESVARVGSAERRCEFVVNVPLDGAPEDRRERILRSMLKDSKTLLRFLLLLLADDPEAIFRELRDGEETSTAWSNAGDWMPLLEQLMRALVRSPERVDQVQRLIEDLRRTPEGRAIVPADLDSILAPIERVRDELRPKSTPPG